MTVGSLWKHYWFRFLVVFVIVVVVLSLVNYAVNGHVQPVGVQQKQEQVVPQKTQHAELTTFNQLLYGETGMFTWCTHKTAFFIVGYRSCDSVLLARSSYNAGNWITHHATATGVVVTGAITAICAVAGAWAAIVCGIALGVQAGVVIDILVSAAMDYRVGGPFECLAMHYNLLDNIPAPFGMFGMYPHSVRGVRAGCA